MQHGQVRTRNQHLGKEEEETQKALSKSHAAEEAIILQYQEVLNFYQTCENRAKEFRLTLALAQEENSKLKYELSSQDLNLKAMQEKAHHFERDKNSLKRER